jgi:hypothetical protein
MQRRALALGVLLAASTAAQAADLKTIQNVGAQSDFRLFSEDLGAALSYKPVKPAEALGVLGFDIGVEATGTKLAHPELYSRATNSSAPSYLVVPKLHAHKGLPLRLDIDAFLSAVPGTNVSLFGAALGFAILKGGVAEPAIELRGTYTKMSGVDQLDFDTKGVELSISKGFAFFTPYAGVGRVQTNSDPKGTAAAVFTNESFSQSKYYLGANLNFGLVNFAVEGDKTGDITSYSAKIGLRF